MTLEVKNGGVKQGNSKGNSEADGRDTKARNAQGARREEERRRCDKDRARSVRHESRQYLLGLTKETIGTRHSLEKPGGWAARASGTGEHT